MWLTSLLGLLLLVTDPRVYMAGHSRVDAMTIPNVLQPDTIILASCQQTIVLDSSSTISQVFLQSSGAKKVMDGNKYLLILKGARLESPPDGAYEVYLSGTKQIGSSLSPDSPFFLTVLDIYRLDDNNKQIVINGSRLLKLLKTAGPGSGYYLTILFRGNQLNGRPSRRAGRIEVQEIQLVQLISGNASIN